MFKFNLKRITEDFPLCIFEELSELDHECFDSENWSAQDFISEAAMPTGIVIAVYCMSQPVGVLAGFNSSDTGEILTLATAKAYRRQGIARMLLNDIFSQLPREVETIALEVRHSNEAAIELYKGFGFELAGSRKRFYSAPVDDADIMVRKLG